MLREAPLSLLQRIFGETKQRAPLQPLYRFIVGRGRDPAWYREGKVPDTIDGRFDMIAAILALVLIRLEAEGEAGRGSSILLTELFIDDMEGELRQIGIGDYVVGKHVGRMMSALGGRLAAFRAGREQGSFPDASERAALARRFGLVALDRLSAQVAISRKGSEVTLFGTLEATATQACVASGAPLAAAIEAPFEILFRPQPEAGSADEEVELGEAEMDVVFYDGTRIDIGEAVAETLALALDPYPRAPDAGEALKAAGVKSEEEAGPFGALAGLRDKLGK